MIFTGLFLQSLAVAQVPIEAPPTAPVYTSSERLGGSFGVGVSMGTPTGITGRLWFSRESAVQFSGGGNLGQQGSLTASMDYITALEHLSEEEGNYFITTYAGVGVGFDSLFGPNSSSMAFGPRLVGGASVTLPTLPIDMFIQVSPTIFVVEDLSWSIGGQIGAHYYL
jgi:hypothetical protein